MQLHATSRSSTGHHEEQEPCQTAMGAQRSLPRAPGALTILSLCICGTNPCPMVCNLATSITANSIHKSAPSRHIKWVLLCLLLPRRVYMITVRAHHCMMKADTARDCPERHASSEQLHSECRLHAAGDARCAHVRIAHGFEMHRGAAAGYTAIAPAQQVMQRHASLTQQAWLHEATWQLMHCRQLV